MSKVSLWKAADEGLWGFILDVRNDLREGFVDQDEISWAEHREFMMKHSPTYRVIASCEGPEVGLVGFVGHVDGDVRVGVCQRAQGRGIAAEALRLAFDEIPGFAAASAKVKKDNLASQALFSKIYTKSGEDEDFVYYQSPVRKAHHSYEIVDMFERTVAGYCRAPYAVAVDSCTNALKLSLEWDAFKYKIPRGGEISIPKRTYLSVPQVVLQHGARLRLREEEWLHRGYYSLTGPGVRSNIIDSAKLLTSGMYVPSSFMCLSFHIKKPLPIGKGGMILTSDVEAAEWLKRRRYEGRTPGLSYHSDPVSMDGYNMYMDPVSAARGLFLMDSYPAFAPPQGEVPNYRDISEFGFCDE